MGVRIVNKSLFEAPPRSILLHACGGIALSFREKYPESYKLYVNHCASHTNEQLLGTTQLIACPEDEETRIACLFTSDRGGRRCDAPSDILDATKRGLMNLKEQVARLEGEWKIAACKFNSGIFKVPWEKSQVVIEEAGLDIDIYAP